jgi:hypothetical protein
MITIPTNYEQLSAEVSYRKRWNAEGTILDHRCI